MIKPSEFLELQKLCMRSFPERLDQRISQVQSLSQGRHHMLALTLSWREGRQPRVERLLVLRYGDPWTWWSLSDQSKALREWHVMRWLYGQGLPLPKLYASGAESGGDFLLMTRVPGRGSRGEAGSISESQTDALARLLARLHGLTPPGTVRAALPEVTVAGELARLREIGQECGNGGLIDAVDQLLVQELGEHPPCVLHGDPDIAKVLCDARGITALLGWENSAMGDPRWDVARIVNRLRSLESEAFVDAFCAAYEDQAARLLSEMSFWEALTAIQGWAVAEWVQMGIGDGRLSPSLATKELLSQRDAWRAFDGPRQR